MALVKAGQIYAIGDVNLTVSAGMFIKDTDYDFPASIRLPAAGTYTNCAKVSTYVLSITNQASDGTFTFPIEWSDNDIDWYSASITGVSYHSEGATNISLNHIRSTIGESTYSLAGICSSSLVNIYSLYKPNGSSPYRLGDFRWYAHGSLGGTYVTYAKPAATVQWGVAYTVRAIGSKRWIEISGKPFATSRVVLFEGATERAETEINFDTTFAAVASYTTAALTPAAETNYTWYAKTQHFTGGSYVDGSSETFTVTQYGRPWTISIDSGPTRIGDTITIQVDYTENATGPSMIRFSGTDSHGTYYEDYPVSGSENNIVISVVNSWGNWEAGYTWTLQVYYNSTWYAYNVT